MWGKFLDFSIYKFTLLYLFSLLITAIDLVFNWFCMIPISLYTGVGLSIMMSVLFLIKLRTSKEV